jgi:hypothetical protein
VSDYEIQYSIANPGDSPARLYGPISPAPLTLLGPFTIKATTPGLTTGVTLCQLPPGAVIYDVGIFVTVGWDGTTPTMDVGSLSGTTGLFDALAGAAVELSDPVTAITDNDGLDSNQDSKSWLAAAVASVGAQAGNTFNPPTVYVSDITTVKAVVSQDGTKGGTATGATTGTALVYVLAATPPVVTAPVS